MPNIQVSKSPSLQVSQQLALIIRVHRKQSGLTKHELSKVAGVSKTVVFDIEHGKDSVQLNILLRLLEVLNIKIYYSSPLIKTDQHEKS